MSTYNFCNSKHSTVWLMPANRLTCQPLDKLKRGALSQDDRHRAVCIVGGVRYGGWVTICYWIWNVYEVQAMLQQGETMATE
jgi:hypothetical protein